MIDIAGNIAHITERIRSAERRFQRPPGAVRLLAVSKGHALAAIDAAVAAGVGIFGENYLQEAAPRLAARPGLEWHFIGTIQSNKTRTIAQRFAWVHAVDNLRIAQRLSDQRPAGLPPLNICIAVNIDAQAGKSGIDPAGLPALAARVAQLPRLHLRGLMTMPAPDPDFLVQRQAFQRVADAQAALQAGGFDLDTLSMGTSADLEAAIAAGATLVRIGTAIFGPRT